MPNGASHALKLMPTSAPGDATRMAQEGVASGADLILVLGGDGTINEVVNGMVHSRVPLGILPAGTANVLAMELGLGANLEKAVERLAGCAEQRVGAGRVCDGRGGSRHFLAMGGVGLDAKIVYDLNPRFKAWAGKFAYWAGGLAHAAQRVGQFEARVNGDVYRCGFALASRVRNYGGDLEIATGASLASDDFEVVLFEGSNPLRYMAYMLARVRARDSPSSDSSAHPSGSRSHTAGMMMIAANIPDVDVVSMLGGSLTYMEYHRSYAHSLALAPLMALIPPLLIFAVFHTRICLAAYVLSLVGVLSHLALDWTNIYGIRLLLPFSSRILRLDITDVVDPWIWSILLLAVAAPELARLVNAEIRSRPVSRSGPGPKRGWAWFALAMLLVYEGVRYTAHDRALAVMGAHLFNDAVPRRLTAVPARFNPLRWRGIAECEGFVDIVPVNLEEPFDPESGQIDYSASPGPAIDAAGATHAFQVFGRFSQVPFWKATPVPEGTLVELIDLRFGTPRNPAFEATALVDASNHALRSQAGFGRIPVRGP